MHIVSHDSVVPEFMSDDGSIFTASDCNVDWSFLVDIGNVSMSTTSHVTSGIDKAYTTCTKDLQHQTQN